MQIPIDAQSLREVADLDRIEWPVKSAECKKWGNELVDLVLEFSHFDNSPTFSDVYRLKVRDILYKIIIFSYNLFTVDRLRKAGHGFVTTKNNLTFSSEKDGSYPLEPFLKIPVVATTQPFSFKSIVKKVVDWTNLLQRDLFSYGFNPLLKQHIQDNQLSPYRLYSGPCSTVKQKIELERLPSFLVEIASTLALRVREVWERYEIKFANEAFNYLNRFIKEELSIANQDVKRSFAGGKMGSKLLLVSTGGHYPNRLLSYYFLRNGNRVIRFDHGADRVLFLDRHWGVNEFAFQNVFVTFGEGLRQRLITNIREGKIPVVPVERQNTEIRSMVSEKLRDIFEKHRETCTREVKKVMLIMPSFGGNSAIPISYTPDMIMLSAIRKTIQELKHNGFYVILKKHPKSIKNKSFSLFDQFVDEINTDYFLEVMDKGDAFVVMGAGTAFCESLMTMKPVVYFHLPFRTVDPWAQSELEKCLCWVDCDDNNGLHIDHKKMISYLKNNEHDMSARRAFIEKTYLSS